MHALKHKSVLISSICFQGSANQIMIRGSARKTNAFCVKALSNSDAIACNLCLERARFTWRPHQTKFNSASLVDSLTVVITIANVIQATISNGDEPGTI